MENQYLYIDEDKRLVISFNQGDKRSKASYSVTGQRKCLCTKEDSKVKTEDCGICNKTSWMMCLIEYVQKTDICAGITIL